MTSRPAARTVARAAAAVVTLTALALTPAQAEPRTDVPAPLAPRPVSAL